MIFKLKEGSVDINEEGDLLLIDIWDDTGARIGIIKMYKDGCIELESRAYGSRGSANFIHPQDFFGSIIEWRDKAERFDSIKENKMEENNTTRASLLVTTDGTFTRGDTIIEFFDKDGRYIGQITAWADGEIWAEAEDIDEEFRFESPQEFLRTLHETKAKRTLERKITVETEEQNENRI